MSTVNSMNKKFTLISILSAIGAAISIWQTRLFYVTRSGIGDGHSFCNIGQTFDCTAIEMSQYSELPGGFPLSGFATAGYLLILIFALYGFSETLRNNIRKILIFFTSLAALFSVVYLGIMVLKIGKLCILCLSVDAINLVLMATAFMIPKAKDEYTPSNRLNFTQFAGAGAAALVIAFLITKGTNPQDGMKKEDMNDLIESVMSTPVTPITIPADAPVIGNPNAPITIVKFSDYECPACGMAARSVHPLMKRYPNEVKFAFLNFPLAHECNTDPALTRTMHEFACEAATVAVCAQEQGKFEGAYTELFANQKDFQAGKIADLVAEKVQGVDLAKLKECMVRPSVLEKIKSDSSLGVAMKIKSTPTFFINGKKVEGGLPTNLWIEVIDRMLNKK